tara:strand:+ start:159149 stop:159886 length:738 start_codon:yes stop_codon:yes gene_type:complete
MVDLDFFERNGYVQLEGVFSDAELQYYTELYDRDLSDSEYFWHPIAFNGHQRVNCDPLISSPDFDSLIRHPKLLEPIEIILKGPSCLAEACLRHMPPHDGEPVEEWHRDHDHIKDRPYRCGFIHMMLYLSEVNENTHCFSISPESYDSPILPIKEQIQQRGKVHIYGQPGTVILFNLSVVHAATVRRTIHERKTVQLYYGHRDGGILSQFTTIPTGFWRDHPDSEVRAFYNLLNTRSQKFCDAFG